MPAPDLTPAITPPRYKENWSVATRKAWVEYWSSPIALHITGSDVSALVSLFDLMDLRDRLRRQGLKEISTRGSMGQVVVNPLLAASTGLNPAILALQDRYGLNPTARLLLTARLGIARNGPNPGAGTSPNEVPEDTFEPIDLAAMARRTG